MYGFKSHGRTHANDWLILNMLNDISGTVLTAVIFLFHRSLQEYVNGMLNDEFPKEQSKKSAVKLVMYCLQNKDHMNVLQLDSSDSAREIDELILQALRKG